MSVEASAAGFAFNAKLRSLTMRQIVQRKTSRSFGHRTSDPQVAHFPVTRSFSACCSRPFWPADVWSLNIAGETTQLSSGVVSRALHSLRPFVLLFDCLSSLRREVNGWLSDRPWMIGRLRLELAEVFVEAGIGASRREVVFCWSCLRPGLSGPGAAGEVWLGAEVPSNRREGQEGIGSKAELIYAR